MKKIFLIALCALVFAACVSTSPEDPDNFETSHMKAVKGHVYNWKHDDQGYGYWEHDSSCVRCIELSHRAHIADYTDSCITIKIYNI